MTYPDLREMIFTDHFLDPAESGHDAAVRIGALESQSARAQRCLSAAGPYAFA